MAGRLLAVRQIPADPNTPAGPGVLRIIGWLDTTKAIPDPDFVATPDNPTAALVPDPAFVIGGDYGYDGRTQAETVPQFAARVKAFKDNALLELRRIAVAKRVDRGKGTALAEEGTDL